MSDKKYFIIDAHCHIYPEKIAAQASAATDHFYDTHGTYHGTVNELEEEKERFGIDHFVVQSVATTPKQVPSINRFIAQTVAQSKGVLTGLGSLHPDSTDIKGDIEHIIEAGLHGVKLHPDIQQFEMDSIRCRKIYDICEEKHLPILMHTGDSRYDYSNVNRLLPIVKHYSDLVIVGAHLGGWSIWDQLGDQLAGYKNLYFDCSSCFTWISPSIVKEFIELYGADHVLFGSDFPMWSPGKELRTFLSMGLGEEDNRKILSENAVRVYGISNINKN